MKVAVQLFGHLRSYEIVAPYLKAHILSLYDCDVFIHTWSEEEHCDPSWHKKTNSAQFTKGTNQARLRELYKPVRLEIEDNNTIDCPGFFNENNNISLRGMKAMSHSQNRVNCLRKKYAQDHNIKYDLVVVLRPDVMPLAHLDLDLYLDEFSYCTSSTIHFSSGSHQHSQEHKKVMTPLASDLFYIAKPETLDHFFELKNDKFERFYVDFTKVNKGGISAPEASFLEALVQSGAVPRFYQFPYAVVRTTGSNHLKANMASLPDFVCTLPLPSYLKEEESGVDNSWSYWLFSKLSNKKLEKVQKQLTRMKRQLDAFSNKLQKIRENR
ncbi:hypothetical protein [Vibrio sinaloensis]|uniref:hypothetical protein n=1 Tax=Photobacterium sp. (strain ATCC 43367) TaxID=379097 RepID=UPI00205D2634|nr:hypothetical protein [Vibrio sinaloensis]UPQ88101.1 hypothetical protein MTO69_00625 [Vibrio sinaloensis]